MTQEIIHIDELPMSTGSCDEGPIIERRSQEMTVQYDYRRLGGGGVFDNVVNNLKKYCVK